MHPNAVQANDVIVTILNPDPSLKSSNLGFVEGMNVKSQAPHITQVLPADRFKAIVSSIKGAIVHHQRFCGEAIHVEVCPQHLTAIAEPVKRSIWNKGNFLNRRSETQPAYETGVIPGNVAQFRIWLIVLNVGLHPGRELHQFAIEDRKSTRLNSSHLGISYAVFCLKKKNINIGLVVSGNFGCVRSSSELRAADP